MVSQQKDTLKRLIELTHSPHSQLKIIAAQNIKLYIKDFPELEDDAINAVYDLCEDPDQKVRVYKAPLESSQRENRFGKKVIAQLPPYRRN